MFPAIFLSALVSVIQSEPICEYPYGDIISWEVSALKKLTKTSNPVLLAICDTGAYGSTMASNYNRHPLPAEMLVDNSTWSVIRRRQTTEEMLAQES